MTNYELLWGTGILTSLEIKALRIWQQQASNEVLWAFYLGETKEDRGIDPRGSLSDEKLLEDTAVEINDAFSWVMTL